MNTVISLELSNWRKLGYEARSLVWIEFLVLFSSLFDVAAGNYWTFGSTSNLIDNSKFVKMVMVYTRKEVTKT